MPSLPFFFSTRGNQPYVQNLDENVFYIYVGVNKCYRNRQMAHRSWFNRTCAQEGTKQGAPLRLQKNGSNQKCTGFRLLVKVFCAPFWQPCMLPGYKFETSCDFNFYCKFTKKYSDVFLQFQLWRGSNVYHTPSNMHSRYYERTRRRWVRICHLLICL